MYEDDGFSDDYLNNPKNSAITNISFIIDDKRLVKICFLQLFSVHLSPSLLNIAMEPVASAADQFIGIPSSRMYQLALPYFWPGSHTSNPSLYMLRFFSHACCCYHDAFISSADHVVVNDNKIPYCTLRDSLSDYLHDCWTYSGP